MNILILVSIAAMSVALAGADDEWVEAKPARNARAVTSIINDPKNACANRPNGRLCSMEPDCAATAAAPSTFFNCVYRKATGVQTCNTATPYCSNGICAADKSPLCDQPQVCPDVGFWPKYDDCRTYYACTYDTSTMNFVTTTMVCPTGTAFNPTGPTGRYCRVGGRCVTAKCAVGRSFEWKPLNYIGWTTNNIALYCVNAKPSGIDKCGDGLSFDVTIQRRVCAIKCTRNYQTAVFETDATKFWECFSGKAYVQPCAYGLFYKFGDPKVCVTAPDTIDPGSGDGEF